MAKSESYIEHRTSRAEKKKPEWYKKWATYVIGMASIDRASDINDKKLVLEGIISDAYYKKVLNPYNAVDKKYTRHRADMRNYDIMKDVIRRYMGEYSKQPFTFQVKCNDAEVITRFNEAFATKITELAIQTFINQLNKQGVNTNQPTAPVPDFQKFFTEFKKEYVDDVAIQGQSLLDAVIDWTESRLLYYKSFYDFIVLGQAFTYRDVRNGQIYKEAIDPTEYFPISNGKPFIEDHDMGLRKFRVTIPELLENFSDVINQQTYDKVTDLFKNYKTAGGGIVVPLSIFKSNWDNETYTTFVNSNATSIVDGSYRMTKDNMVDGYHIVASTQVKIGNLVYSDPITGQIREDIIEKDEYTLDPTKGDISIAWEWVNEVWETYMFGTESDDIFSEPRPIAYQRRDANNINRVKLPYNGLSEVVPGTGFTFSIPDAILPFQLSRNIFAFYRERIIAKNKDKIVVIPESLLGDTAKQEDKIYRIENSGIFPYDDSEDDSGSKAQNIRVIDAGLSQFISHITDLIDRMKMEAWDTVDMNAQRYGDINTSAGKGTTEEAIIRSSMGSVIIFTMFEKFLEKEYLADLDYSKVAYVDGKKGTYTDGEGISRFLDLDTDKHILANYGVHVVSSVSQNDKKRALQNLSQAATQNGNFKLAVTAIVKDNVATIERAFEDFDKAQQEYQQSIANEKEQINQQTTQIKAQNDGENRNNLMEIAKLKDMGDTQRAVIAARVELMKLQSSPDANNNGTPDQIELMKIELAKMEQDLDMRIHNDTMDSQEKDRKSKEKIAATKNTQVKKK